MRHRKAGKRLGRRKEERIALQRNLTASLFDQFGEDKEYIRTTITKAKWVKSFAERCITLGTPARAWRFVVEGGNCSASSLSL